MLELITVDKENKTVITFRKVRPRSKVWLHQLQWSSWSAGRLLSQFCDKLLVWHSAWKKSCQSSLLLRRAVVDKENQTVIASWKVRPWGKWPTSPSCQWSAGGLLSQLRQIAGVAFCRTKILSELITIDHQGKKTLFWRLVTARQCLLSLWPKQ